MKKLLMFLLALMLCVPVLAVAGEEWPDLTGEWRLSGAVKAGRLYEAGDRYAYALVLEENLRAVYFRNGREIEGTWDFLATNQVVVEGSGGEQYLFAVVNGMLVASDAGASFSLYHVETDEEHQWQPLQNAGNVPGFDLVAQSDVLELYAKAETGEIAVYDKRNGCTTWSNPQDADQVKVAGKTNRGRMKSQFYLEYVNANGVSGSFQSYRDCVDYDQIVAWTIPGGVAFEYEVGDPQSVYYVPEYLTDVRYQELYWSVGDDVKKLMCGLASSFYEQRADGGWYVTENGKKMGIRNMYKISEAFIAAGMTEDEYWYWQGLVGIQRLDLEQFVLAMEWTLEDDTVTCRIPAERIEEKGGLVLTAISVAPWLGAVKGINDMHYQVGTYEGIVDAEPSEYRYALARTSEGQWEMCQRSGFTPMSKALMSDDETSILITVPQIPRYACFEVRLEGMNSWYDTMNYKMNMREKYVYSAENLPGENDTKGRVYIGDLYDVIVRYQFLNEPCLLSEAE